MKNIIKKISCLVAVVVIVLASFILPASAASGTIVSPLQQYIDFTDPNAVNNTYKIGKSANVSYSSDTSFFAKNPLSSSDFFCIYSSPNFELNNDWFGAIIEFEADNMWDGEFTYRYNNVKYYLFNIQSNNICLGRSGQVIFSLNDGKCQISFMFNIKTHLLYYAVDASFGDDVSSFVSCDMTDYYERDESSDRVFCFYTTRSQTFTTPDVHFSKFILYDIPYADVGLSMHEYFNSYRTVHDSYRVGVDKVYKQGYDNGYNDGYSNGENIGYNTGYNVGLNDGIVYGKELGFEEGIPYGYENGFIDGYNSGVEKGKEYTYNDGYKAGAEYGYADGFYSGYEQGSTDVYNELYEKGLEAIDENEGTLMQGFLSGMWNGVQNFVQELLDGITFSDLSLRKIVTTLLAIVLAAFVIRLVKG